MESCHHKNCCLADQNSFMIGMIRSSKLGLKCVVRSRAMSKIVADITGNPYKLTSDKAAWNMDESIIDMLSSNNDARPKLREILQDDAGSSFSKILILFENLRYGMDYRIPEIAQSLVEIEGMLVEGTGPLQLVQCSNLFDLIFGFCIIQGN